MKKRWIWLGGGAAAIGLALFAIGPDLLGVYRFETYVSANNKAYEADGPWPHLTDVCTACHISVDQRYPNLAGQPAAYLTAEIRDFASGKRASPNMRLLAMTLSDAEVKVIADYFAHRAATPNQYFHPDPALQARGKALAAASGCAACHGDDFMGHDRYPRLAGQGYDYLAKQLDAFASDQRSEETGTMNRLAKAVTPADRKAIATYLAALNPVNK